MKILENNQQKILGVVFFIWIFIISFYILLFSGLSSFANRTENNSKAPISFSVYKPGISILNNLKDKNYFNYIQRIYVHPKEANKLIIMIKPNYWGVIDQGEKDEILSEALDKWEKLYKNLDAEKEDLKPEVHFANSSF